MLGSLCSLFVRLVFSFLFGVALYLILALGESPDGQFGGYAVGDSVHNTSPVSWIMASNYGAADASNTAVRAFLWKAGAQVWGSNFNVKSGKGVEIWRL